MKKLLLITALLLVGIETTDAQIIIGSRGVTVQQRKERVKEPIVKNNEVGTWTQAVGLESTSLSFGVSYLAYNRISSIFSVGWGGALGFAYPVIEVRGSILADMFNESLSSSRFSPYVGMDFSYGYYDVWYFAQEFDIKISPKIGFDIILNKDNLRLFWDLAIGQLLFNDDNFSYHMNIGIKF